MENLKIKVLSHELMLDQELKAGDKLSVAFSLTKAHFFDSETELRIRNN